jgi:hypothetical protein
MYIYIAHGVYRSSACAATLFGALVSELNEITDVYIYIYIYILYRIYIYYIVYIYIYISYICNYTGVLRVPLPLRRDALRGAGVGA